jgi:hypothetical protein
MKKKINCDGHAILELALVLPVLGLLALGGIELSRAMITTQIATSLSKQIATIAYRECIADKATVKSADSTNQTLYYNPTACIQAVGDSLKNTQQIHKIAPGTEYIISMYSYDGTATNPVSDDLGGPLKWGAGASAPVSDSKFTTGNFSDASGVYGAALKKYETLIIAEVFVPYESVFRRVLNIFFFEPGVIYATTIL